MAPNPRLVVAVLLTFALTAQSTECRLLQQTATAASGAVLLPAAGRACSTVCSTPVLMANAFVARPTSYACVANVGASSAPGYQAGAGSTTCLAAIGDQAVTSEDYSCLCLAASQTQGLAKPDASGNCASSCQSYAGQIGAPITAAGANLCMATSEIGSTNHFGFTSGLGTCSYASGTALEQSSAFSCVCAYGAVASSQIAPASNSSLGISYQMPQPQLATAG